MQSETPGRFAPRSVPECLLLHVDSRSRPPPTLRTVNIPFPRWPHPATRQIYRGPRALEPVLFLGLALEGKPSIELPFAVLPESAALFQLVHHPSLWKHHGQSLLSPLPPRLPTGLAPQWQRAFRCNPRPPVLHLTAVSARSNIAKAPARSVTSAVVTVSHGAILACPPRYDA